METIKLSDVAKAIFELSLHKEQLEKEITYHAQQIKDLRKKCEFIETAIKTFSVEFNRAT